MAVTIRGLSSLVKLLDRACYFIGVYGPKIREHVPSDKLADYDAALAAILAACTAIKAIDYLLDGIGTS